MDPFALGIGQRCATFPNRSGCFRWDAQSESALLLYASMCEMCTHDNET